MPFPNRNCTHGNRLHHTGSLRHSQSATSQSSQGDMTRFGLFDNFDSSTHSTPIIDESEFSYTSTYSTPCPPGPSSATPRGRALPTSDTEEPIVLVPNSTTDQGQGEEQEDNRLRTSMATLREELASSTALINNLRTRNDVFQAENNVKEAELKEAMEERDSARAVVDSVTEDGETFRRFVLTAMSLILVVVLVYSYWCWHNGPEMQYVLRRRREVLGI